MMTRGFAARCAGQGVKTVASYSTLCSRSRHHDTNPLTPRLAVPPLPQGGEGKRIVSLVIELTVGLLIWTALVGYRRNLLNSKAGDPLPS